MSDYEKAIQLWDQYKYRHEHCWKLLFQVTAAAVIISVVPYTHLDRHKYVIMALPAIAVGLIAFSIRRINIELKLWQAVRSEHVKLQKNCFKIDEEFEKKAPFDMKKDNFRSDVLWYLGILGALALTNCVLIWIEQLKTPPASP